MRSYGARGEQREVDRGGMQGTRGATSGARNETQVHRTAHIQLLFETRA